MDSSHQPVTLLDLPDVLLVIIISLLPFKECVRTSILSRCWKKLCHETRNIAFKYCTLKWWEEAWASFLWCMLLWGFRSQFRDIFEISVYIPLESLAEILTVSPYLLQAIPEATHPEHMLHPVETQHLGLRTRMLIVNNYPDLETLTFNILPPAPFMTTLTNAGIDPETYWLQNITNTYLRNRVKIELDKYFGSDPNKLNKLKYLIRSGRAYGRRVGAMLERVNVYLTNGMKKGLRMVALYGAEML